MSKDTIDQLQDNIRKAKEHILTRNALARLQNNADFQRVVVGGYLKEEAIRLVHLRGDPAFQSDERQKSILVQIDSIANLASYFNQIGQMASMAERSIANDELTIEELAAEDLQK